MPDVAEVRGRVAIRRVVAAADLPAVETHPEVNPAGADLQALLAAQKGRRQRRDLNGVEVGAGFRTGTLVTSCQ